MSRKSIIAVLVVLVASAYPAVADTGQARAVRSAAVDLELVTTFDPEQSEFPKGIAFDSAGNMYVGMQFLGEVRKFAPDGTQETIATVPYGGPLGSGLLNAVGVVEGPGAGDVTVYAAFADVDTGQATGLYRIQGGSVSRLPGTEAIAGNGMAVDDNGNVYVAESFTGSIWRIGHNSGAVDLWLQHELLEGDGSLGFGVSLGVGGMVVDSQSLLVTVEEKSRVVRIGINADGSAGSASVVVEDPALYMAEGITIANDGLTYVSSWFNSSLSTLNEDGTLGTIADAEDGLLGPVTLAVGKGPVADYLYVVNQSGFIFENPQPALYRLRPASSEPAPAASPAPEAVPSSGPTTGAPLPPDTGNGFATSNGGSLPFGRLLAGLIVIVGGGLLGAAAVRHR